MSSISGKRIIRIICTLMLFCLLSGFLFSGCTAFEESLPTESNNRTLVEKPGTALPTETDLPTNKPLPVSSEPTPEIAKETSTPIARTESPKETQTPFVQTDHPEETERPITYVVNTNTKKFHYPSCSSVKDTKPSNRWDFYGEREELIDKGYVPCKRCNP